MMRDDGDLPQTRYKVIILFTLIAVAMGSFISLGVWQLERRAWKHELIANVDARVYAKAAPAPAPKDWASITDDHDAYRHVSLRGTYLQGSDTLVDASTILGPGDWVLTPLKTTDGYTVIVNRGFIPANFTAVQKAAAAPPQGEVDITGFLRINEPQGRALRPNRPGDDKWYSRDVFAIATARGITGIAPYFVDIESGVSDAWPRTGLTRINFPDNHLIYALTWFGLALMLGAWTIAVIAKHAWVKTPKP